jgi:hypothetical protein
MWRKRIDKISSQSKGREKIEDVEKEGEIRMVARTKGGKDRQCGESVRDKNGNQSKGREKIEDVEKKGEIRMVAGAKGGKR